jgi:hypothetical protein
VPLRLACQFVDGQRGFPDNTEPRWYGAGGSYGENDWGKRGGEYPEQPRPEEGYRVPEARPYEDAGQGRYADLAGQPAGGPVTAPVSGGRYDTARGSGAGEPGRPGEPLGGGPRVAEPAQPVSGPGQVQADQARHFPTQPIERSGPRRDPAQDAVPGSVYRTKRPAAAIVIGAVVLIFEIVTLRIFATGAFASPIRTQGAVGGMFLFVGLPLFGYGLYALITGAAATGAGARPWLRTPLAYLPIGLSLLICAALASA